MPGVQARSSVGGAWEVTTHWCFSPFLPPFPSLSKKKKVYPMVVYIFGCHFPLLGLASLFPPLHQPLLKFQPKHSICRVLEQRKSWPAFLNNSMAHSPASFLLRVPLCPHRGGAPGPCPVLPSTPCALLRPQLPKAAHPPGHSMSNNESGCLRRPPEPPGVI